MNTESSQDQTAPMTTGEHLRQAREKMGLSQQAVAERLCLKLSTVRDLEEDNTQADLASTFLRGYIRSYAKFVQIPEDVVESLIAKGAPAKAAKVAPMQSFSLGKSRKRRDGWLMMFTALVFLVVVGLTGTWWWQNHQAQQDEIATMAEQSSVQLSNNAAGQPVPLQREDPSPVVPETSTAAESASTPVPLADNSASTAVPTAPGVVAPSQASLPGISDVAAQLPTAAAQVSAPVAAASTDALVMNFSGDCWLEVKDGNGKTLFSGMKNRGGTLSLSGQQPFHLKLGAPAVVEIQFQGKPVDLSRFVRSSSVARLSLPAQ